MRTTIPDGTQIRITVGSAPPALSYRFTTGASGQPLTPKAIRWASDPKPFVNTGRHPIALYDYLFDDGAGKVGHAGAGEGLADFEHAGQRHRRRLLSALS